MSRAGITWTCIAAPRRCRSVRTAAALLWFSGVAYAQSTQIGQITDVRHAGELHFCPTRGSQSPPGAVKLARGRVSFSPSTDGDTPVDLRDSISVRRNTDVRLRVQSSEFGRGAFFLAPELLRCTRLDTDTVTRETRFARADVASYHVRDTVQLSDSLPSGEGRALVFEVVRGAAYIQWNPTGRRLLVQAAGEFIRVDSTSLAVVVDSAGNLALLYVEQGAVTLLRQNALRVRSGSAFELTRGRIATELRFGSVEARSDIRSNLRFHGRAVYGGRPFWRDPRFYLAVGAGTVGTAVLCNNSSICSAAPDRPPRRGSIVVRIPL